MDGAQARNQSKAAPTVLPWSRFVGRFSFYYKVYGVILHKMLVSADLGGSSN